MQSYDEYFAMATAKGNTPFTPEAVNYFIQDAIGRGATMSQIDTFLASNPGDYNRISEALDFVSTQQHQTVSIGAGNVLQTVAGLTPSTFTRSAQLPAPAREDSEIIAQYQTSGVAPTNATAGPTSLGGYSSNALGGATLFNARSDTPGVPATTAGLFSGGKPTDWTLWIVLGVIAVAGYYAWKKGIV